MADIKTARGKGSTDQADGLVRTTIRLPEALHRAAKSAAATAGISLQDLITDAITAALARLDRKR